MNTLVSENWDDDFEFTAKQKSSFDATRIAEDWDAEQPSQETENWDDDFEDARNSPKKPTTRPPREENWDDDDDDSAELGLFADKEEDRTVTARSRRAALSKLSPPPLPTTTHMPSFLTSLEPAINPHSPTSSVFSVPTTINTYNSTTHLRPTGTFALLPPSPPIHRERERRRLRKKSRPRPPGMFELGTIPAGVADANTRYSFSDDGDASEPVRARSETPKSDIDQPLPPLPLNNYPPVPATPSKGAALLSRIGSVKKKWAVRRRGGSTTPADVIDSEAANNNQDPSQLTPRPQSSMSSFHDSVSKHRHSIPAAPTKPSQDSPPTSSNWFFRASSAGSPRRASAAATTQPPSSLNNKLGRRDSRRQSSRARTGADSDSNHSLSQVDLHAQRERERASMYTPSPLPNNVASTSNTTTPTKLIKRKSLGFVQLRRNFGGHSGTGENESPNSVNKTMDDGDKYGKKWVSRYSGLGMGRAGPRDVGSEPEAEEERPRRKSLSRFLDPPSSASQSVESVPKEKEGSRGFMGSMRRLSLVSAVNGRHKRTKSGSGLALSSPQRNLSPPPPPLPHTLPPLPSSSSQLSLRIPSTGSAGVESPFPLSESSSRNVSSNASIAQPPLPPVPALPQTPRRTTSKSSRKSRKSIENGAELRRSNSQPREAPQSRRPSIDNPPKTPSRKPVPLLPPIELQPPSPPRTVTKNRSNTVSGSADGGPGRLSVEPLSLSLSFSPTSPSTVFFTPTSGNKLNVSPSGRSPGTQQSASLGRSTPIKSGMTSESGGSAGDEPGGEKGAGVPRRNSLGDLKIPARISQAQVGLRRDLGMVREFAGRVEQLKELQSGYYVLVSDVQKALDKFAKEHADEIETSNLASPIELSPTSPTSFFGNIAAAARKGRPKTRARSNTNPTPAPPQPAPPRTNVSTNAQVAYQSLASRFYAISTRYQVTWECAELLVELGGGETVSSAPPTSAPPMTPQQSDVGGTRERAVTLIASASTGPENTGNDLVQPQPLVGSTSLPATGFRSPSSTLEGGPHVFNANSWRASSGRHDLSQRQLVLLREMLNHTPTDQERRAMITEDQLPAHASVGMSAFGSMSQLQLHHGLGFVNKDWRWGDAGGSTITLPVEGEEDLFRNGRTSIEAKRRSGRVGMMGIRDMLRALKKGQQQRPEDLREDDQGRSQPRSASAMGLAPSMSTSMMLSTTSLSTESSVASHHRYPHPRIPSGSRRKAKVSTGPESLRSTTKDIHHSASPFNPPSYAAPKPSPRRPSLASIFRIGKNRPSSVVIEDKSVSELQPLPALPTAPMNLPIEAQAPSSRLLEDSGSSSGTGEEDWDRMDSASDLDAAAKALGIGEGTATVRLKKKHKGKSPYLQRPDFDATSAPPLPSELPEHTIIHKSSFNASQTSLYADATPQQALRPTRLSNVEEHPLSRSESKTRGKLRKSRSPGRQSSRSKGNSGSIRNNLAQTAVVPAVPLPDYKPSMTPENIKPLLENAKVVHAKLVECLEEVRELLVPIKVPIVGEVIC